MEHWEPLLGAGLVAAAILLAVGPSPELGLILQAAGAGGLVGAGFAYRARRRDPDHDTWLTTTEWALAGAGVALLFELAVAII
jgi:hypothetical protein